MKINKKKEKNKRLPFDFVETPEKKLMLNIFVSI